MINFHESNCCIEHVDAKYCASGASVSDKRIAVYIDGREGVGCTGRVTDWHGDVLGQYVVTGRWRIPNGVLSSHMHSFRVTLDDGRVYNCRGAGDGMLATGRRAKQ